jgi:hypothetical protein
MLYRILTENKNYENTIKLVSSVFSGFTMLAGSGFWQGKEENCLIIEIDTENAVDVCYLAIKIQQQNKQESVLVQRIDCKSTFVSF